MRESSIEFGTPNAGDVGIVENVAQLTRMNDALSRVYAPDMGISRPTRRSMRAGYELPTRTGVYPGGHGF
ncbi:hypothetical protein ABI048_15600, partial [Enterococcus faecium]